MLRFGETKIAKEKFYGAKKPLNIWDFNVDNIVVSRLIETNNNSKYLIGYFDEVIRSFNFDIFYPTNSLLTASFKKKLLSLSRLTDIKCSYILFLTM